MFCGQAEWNQIVFWCYLEKIPPFLRLHSFFLLQVKPPALIDIFLSMIFKDVRVTSVLKSVWKVSLAPVPCASPWKQGLWSVAALLVRVVGRIWALHSWELKSTPWGGFGFTGADVGVEVRVTEPWVWNCLAQRNPIWKTPERSWAKGTECFLGWVPVGSSPCGFTVFCSVCCSCLFAMQITSSGLVLYSKAFVGVIFFLKL